MGKRNIHKKTFRKMPDGYFGAMLRMLPAIIMVSLVPLIVRDYKYETGLTKHAWYHGDAVFYDLFVGWKAVVLMVLAFMMVGAVVMHFLKEGKRLSFTKLFFPLFGYGILAFLSACASKNPSFSFSGGYEQFESVWVLLSYVLIVYYVFIYTINELEMQVLADALCFCCTVISLLGALQGVGLNIFLSRVYQKLITTESFLNQMGGELSTNVGENHAVATLGNPNYMGVFCSFMLPFLISLFLHEKNKWRRIWHGLNIVLTVMALLSSRSRAGMIAAAAALFVMFIFAARKILKWWYLTIPALNLLVVIVLLINAYNDDMIFERFKNVFAKDKDYIEEEYIKDGTVIYKTGLTELYTADEGIVFSYNKEKCLVYFYVNDDEYGIYAEDVTGNVIELIPNEDITQFTFQHPALKDIAIEIVSVEGELGFRLHADGEWCFLYNNTEKCYQYLDPYGNMRTIIMADSFGFENYQKALSGRGYIWSRTLPLLMEHIFLGSGPDTFILEFPQDDYLKKKQNGYEYQLITKPHSWYLQMGVQTGVLSLLCILVFYGCYAIWSIRLYAFKKISTQTETFGLAAFIGSIGYMVSGISNDSMVVTAPVFWGMIALGVTANVLVEKQRKQDGMNG